MSIFKSNVVKISWPPVGLILKCHDKHFGLTSADMHFDATAQTELVLRCVELPKYELSRIMWYARLWNAIRGIALTPIPLPKIRETRKHRRASW